MKSEDDLAIKIVDGAYRGLLGREPDPTGREAWTAWLLQNKIDIEHFLREFSSAKEVEWRFIERAKARGKLPFVNENSQYGEIGIFVEHVFNSVCRNKIIVDVGARGIERSNSYDLMKHLGWRGILVEAHPELCKALSYELQGLDAAVVHSAVSDFEGEAELFLGINLDISSLNESAAASWGEVKGAISVPVKRLPNILRSHKVPNDFDLLSIDIEGEDIKVFNDTWEQGFRPQWVIIEASYGKKVTSLDQLDLLSGIKEEYKIFDSTESNLLIERFKNL